MSVSPPTLTFTKYQPALVTPWTPPANEQIVWVGLDSTDTWTIITSVES